MIYRGRLAPILRFDRPWPGERRAEWRRSLICGLWKKITSPRRLWTLVESRYNDIQGQARTHLALRPPLAWRKAGRMASMANLRQCLTLLVQSEGALAEPTAHRRTPGRGVRGLEGLGSGRSERSGRMTSPGKRLHSDRPRPGERRLDWCVGK